MKIFSGRGAIKALLFGLLVLPPPVLLLPTLARAQQEGGVASSEDDNGQAINGQNDRRGDLIRALNLSPEQVDRIKEIQKQNRQERRAAAVRLLLAQRALDEAIYSDATSEALVEERARELASAQAAAVRLRAQTEYNIRRVLTPDQLTSFRNLRQQARVAARNRRLRAEQNRGGAIAPDEQQQRNRLRRLRSVAPPRKDVGSAPDASTAPRDRRGGSLRGRNQ